MRARAGPLTGAAACQAPQSDEADDDDFEESLEEEAALAEAACDALPPLARALTAPRFLPLWQARTPRLPQSVQVYAQWPVRNFHWSLYTLCMHLASNTTTAP